MGNRGSKEVGAAGGACCGGWLALFLRWLHVDCSCAAAVSLCWRLEGKNGQATWERIRCPCAVIFQALDGSFEWQIPRA